MVSLYKQYYYAEKPKEEQFSFAGENNSASRDLVLQTVSCNACCLIHSSAIGCSKLLIVQANKKVTIQQSCVVLYNYNHAESRKAVLECFDVALVTLLYTGYTSLHQLPK